MTRPPPAEHFFLPGPNGRIYCVHHPAHGERRGALLYVPPFGEEMNRTRRAATLAARALAARGWAVLQPDLHGTGDSDGEFGNASWDGWKIDLALTHDWLAEKTGQAVGLWGLRLGALLALDYARTCARTVERFLLWQPVLRGAVYLNQLLRIRLAGEILAGGKPDSKALRGILQTEAMEIGGYTLAPALAEAIEAVDAAAMPAPGAPVSWIEMVTSAEQPVSRPAQQQALTWRIQGAEVRLEAVHDVACWNTQDVAECPQLRAATIDILAGRS